MKEPSEPILVDTPWLRRSYVQDNTGPLWKPIVIITLGPVISANYADKVHVPPVPLNVLTAPWPFAMWGIDMIGEIRPTASNRHHFILVAIDYFMKWVEAASFATVTKNVVERFIRHNLICQYGVLERTITDNGTNLNNTMITELYKQFKIHLTTLLPIGRR